MEEATQAEINMWELENSTLIKRWIKDFEKETIQYCFDDKCTEFKTFKII